MKTEAWLNALRSGTYGQAKEALADGNGNYCCLGVLCEISGLPVEVEDLGNGEKYVQYLFETPEDFQRAYNAKPISKADSTLPYFASTNLLEDLDLNEKVDALEDGPEGTDVVQSLHDRLMHLNDGGWTFREIADYIAAVQEYDATA